MSGLNKKNFSNCEERRNGLFQFLLFVLFVILSAHVCIFLLYDKNLFGCITSIIGFVCLAGIQHNYSRNCKIIEEEKKSCLH